MIALVSQTFVELYYIILFIFRKFISAYIQDYNIIYIIVFFFNDQFCFILHVFIFILFQIFADVVDYSDLVLPTESSGATLYPPVFRPKGIKQSSA